VSLSLGVLLECVRDRDGSVAQILAIHCLNGCIRGFKTGVVYKCKSFAVACLRVSLNLRSGEDDTKGRKRVVEKFLVNFGVEITNKYIGSDIQIFLVRRGLVDSDRLAKEFDHVHYLDGVVSIVLTEELHKAVTLVLHGDSVLRHVDIDHWPGLHE